MLRTPPVPHAESFVRFAVVADMGTPGCFREALSCRRSESVAQAIAEDVLDDSLGNKDPAPGHVLVVGDVSYAVGSAYLWARYGAQMEAIGSRVPIHVSSGNHEYDSLNVPVNGVDISGASYPGFAPFRPPKNDSGGECGVAVTHYWPAPASAAVLDDDLIKVADSNAKVDQLKMLLNKHVGAAPLPPHSHHHTSSSSSSSSSSSASSLSSSSSATHHGEMSEDMMARLKDVVDGEGDNDVTATANNEYENGMESANDNSDVDASFFSSPSSSSSSSSSAATTRAATASAEPGSGEGSEGDSDGIAAIISEAAGTLEEEAAGVIDMEATRELLARKGATIMGLPEMFFLEMDTKLTVKQGVKMGATVAASESIVSSTVLRASATDAPEEASSTSPSSSSSSSQPASSSSSSPSRPRRVVSSNHGFWYTYNYGPVHIIVLSSEHSLSNHSPQYLWLIATLRSIQVEARSASPSPYVPWIVVSIHRPLYASDPASLHGRTTQYIRTRLEPLLALHRVDLVLTGHYHYYERTCPVLDGHCTGTFMASPTEVASTTAGEPMLRQPETYVQEPRRPADHPEGPEPFGVVHVLAGVGGVGFHSGEVSEPEWVRVTDLVCV